MRGCTGLCGGGDRTGQSVRDNVDSKRALLHPPIPDLGSYHCRRRGRRRSLRRRTLLCPTRVSAVAPNRARCPRPCGEPGMRSQAKASFHLIFDLHFYTYTVYDWGPPRHILTAGPTLFMYVYAETVEKLDCTCAVWGKPGLGQGRGEGGEMGGTKIKTAVVLRVGSHSTLCITVPTVIAGPDR